MTGIADRYTDRSRRARFYRALRLRLGGLREVAALFPDEGLVVDLGCGMGLLAHLLVAGHPGRRVLAVDHDAERVEMLRASAAGLPIETRLEDMATALLPACRGIALVDVLHYLDADAQEALIARAVAALEPGGTLVLRDPDPEAGWRYHAARLHELLAVGIGWTQARIASFRGGREWAALLRAHGLEARRLPLKRASPYADRIVVGAKP